MTVWTFAIVLATVIVYGLLMFCAGYRHAQIMAEHRHREERRRRRDAAARSYDPRAAPQPPAYRWSRHPRVERARQQLQAHRRRTGA